MFSLFLKQTKEKVFLNCFFQQLYYSNISKKLFSNPSNIFISTDYSNLLKNPSDYQDYIYNFNNNPDILSDNICIIKHPFPKANYHYMILPTCSLSSWKIINETHLHLFYEMKEKSNEILLKLNNQGIDAKRGIFAEQGCLKQIGIHVISSDMDSEYLNTKRLWNMFNSEFFMDVDYIISMLKDTGKITIDKSKYIKLLQQNLHCNKCYESFKTFKLFKNHLCNQEIEKQMKE